MIHDVAYRIIFFRGFVRGFALATIFWAAILWMMRGIGHG